MWSSTANKLVGEVLEEGCRIIHITERKLMCVFRRPEEAYQIIFLLVDIGKSVVFCNYINLLAKFQGKRKGNRIPYILEA